MHYAAPHFARLVLLALVLLGLVGCAADIPESGQDDLRNFFDRTDTNGDGKLDVGEHQFRSVHELQKEVMKQK